MHIMGSWGILALYVCMCILTYLDMGEGKGGGHGSARPGYRVLFFAGGRFVLTYCTAAAVGRC